MLSMQGLFKQIYKYLWFLIFKHVVIQEFWENVILLFANKFSVLFFHFIIGS